ncbi:glycosyltransferase family 9 protein [Shewanella surugensis]|uniref:Glycosyltransferase family 9 protein n=1 Tax=Shewanella surugensis TaxID=212020 RepID=A0ABT0LBE7_9GAMM|nr:glycosyltransferase family 9 protein [Shewanella surugensis]MCL1125021.1 glycosyltransferase family 9 protein [Shewanella surugensis]
MKRKIINNKDVMGNVLVVLPKYIGDAINTTPSIGMLRAHFPDKKIILLVRAYLVPLFERDDRYDVTVLVDHRYTAKSRLSLLNQARLIKGLNCELAIVMRNSFSDALLCWLSGIDNRIGYANEGRSFLLTHSYPFNSNRHYLQRYAYLANEPFGRPFNHMPNTYLYSDKINTDKYANNIKIGVYFGGKYKLERHYPSDLAIQSLLTIAAEISCEFCIFGDQSEADDNAILTQSLEQNNIEVRDLSGKTSLSGLVDAIAAVDVILTIDSGPLHMAAAIGTPYVAIVGLGTSPWSLVEPKTSLGVSLFANGRGLIDAELIREISPECILAAILSLNLPFKEKEHAEEHWFQKRQSIG